MPRIIQCTPGGAWSAHFRRSSGDDGRPPGVHAIPPSRSLRHRSRTVGPRCVSAWRCGSSYQSAGLRRNGRVVLAWSVGGALGGIWGGTLDSGGSDHSRKVGRRADSILASQLTIPLRSTNLAWGSRSSFARTLWSRMFLSAKPIRSFFADGQVRPVRR